MLTPGVKSPGTIPLKMRHPNARAQSSEVLARSSTRLDNLPTTPFSAFPASHHCQSKVLYYFLFLRVRNESQVAKKDINTLVHTINLAIRTSRLLLKPQQIIPRYSIKRTIIRRPIKRAFRAYALYGVYQVFPPRPRRCRRYRELYVYSNSNSTILKRIYKRAKSRRRSQL